jgi:hypothetical protein
MMGKRTLENGRGDEHDQQTFKAPNSPSSPQVTAVKRMSRAAAIYEDCAFPAKGRRPELGGRKNDEGRNTQVGAPRGNKAFCSTDAGP